MNDEDRNALAGEYVLGLLDGAARREAEDLLHDDARFAALVQEWERRLMPLAEASREIPPPAQLWARIAAATRPAPGWSARRTAWFSGRMRLGVAGLGIALAAAVLLFALRSPLDAGHQIAALQDRDGGSFIVQQTRNGLIITAQNISVPAGRAAELWVLAPGHAPRAIGVFQPGHTLNMALPNPAITGLALAVSLEPPGGAPGPLPTGPIIAEGSITLM